MRSPRALEGVVMPESQKTETLAKDLVLAGLESVRQLGGEDLVQMLLERPGMPDLGGAQMMDERVPLDFYLQYRDAALDFFQDAYALTAFQTGIQMVENLENGAQRHQLQMLVKRFRHTANPLLLLGQAAVLAAEGNPGKVRATADRGGLVLSIENCPECRGLRHSAPICYLNQGVATEFARRFLNIEVRTSEVRCSALGDPCCEIRVTRVD